LGDADSSLLHVACQRLHYGSYLITLLTHRLKSDRAKSGP
jgi:hypothetical protein